MNAHTVGGDPDQEWVRRCQTCRGDGWVPGTDGRERTIAPCPTCKPVTAALNDAGHYAVDAAFAPDQRDAVAQRAETTAERKTALFAWPQLLETWPVPGFRPPADPDQP